MAYDPVPEREEGGQDRSIVSDELNRDVLEEILLILKKIEYHLSVGSGEEFDGEEPEE